MKKKVMLKAGLRLIHSGKMFLKILNVPCVWLGKISSLNHNHEYEKSSHRRILRILCELIYS